MDIVKPRAQMTDINIKCFYYFKYILSEFPIKISQVEPRKTTQVFFRSREGSAFIRDFSKMGSILHFFKRKK